MYSGKKITLLRNPTTYNSQGIEVGTRRIIDTATSEIIGEDAAGTSDGGYVFAAVSFDTVQQHVGLLGSVYTYTLTVKTDKLAAIPVDQGTYGAYEYNNVTGTYSFRYDDAIGNTSVTANADGSFDVFWSGYYSGRAAPSSYTEYEQVYSATGRSNRRPEDSRFKSAWGSFWFVRGRRSWNINGRLCLCGCATRRQPHRSN